MLRTPRGPVAQHRPACDEQPPCDSDDGNLLPGADASAHPVEDLPEVFVVAADQPRHLHEQCPQEHVATLGDAAVA